LEVLNEHVYRVAEQGLLVHNACLQNPITHQLTQGERNSYRADGRRKWNDSNATIRESHYPGQGLVSDQIHHRIPLEYAHIFPKVDPNSIANIPAVPKIIHEKINTEWNSFRNSNSNPTASDIMKFTMEIDKKYGYAMYWLR
jgi:hypothetical protein